MSELPQAWRSLEALHANTIEAPVWVKTDLAKYPRVIRRDGEPIDVLSPLSRNTVEADK